MAKRIADDQITRETLHDENSDDETMSGVPKPTIASSDVMSRRKIAMPKKKMAFTNRSSTAAAASESSFANAFSFAKKPTPSGSNEKEEKLTALNLQFKDKIVNIIKTDPCVNLTTLFAKYESYISSINGVTLPSTTNAAPIIKEKPIIAEKIPTVSITPTLQKSKVEPESEESSSSDEEVETKVEGPSFTIASNPIKSDSVFSFGKKKVEKPKDDSDSESDIEIKGPEFTFSGAVKSDVFKFNGKTASTEPKKPMFGQGNGATTTSIAEKTEEIKPAPSFTFGVTKQPETANKSKDTGAKLSFGVGADTNTNPPKSVFSFGAAPTTSSQNTPSLFGNAPKTNETSTDTKKPSFTFGAKPLSSDSSDKPVEKPMFAFGAKPQQPTDAEPAKPKFTFGVPAPAPEATKEPSSTPSFSFGSNKETDNSAIKPSFTFGVSDMPSAINEEGSTTKPVFSFGSTDTEKPKFTFGTSVAPKETEKPKFDFSVESSENKDSEDKTKDVDATKTPSFSFGASTNTTAAPSFSFGKPAQANPFAPSSVPSTASSSEKANVPSGGFKFSLPFQQNKSTEGSSEQTKSSVPATETPNIAEEKKQETSDVTPSEGDKDTKESSVSMQNGEEDENATFMQRAKLMIFNTETKAYDSRGVGEMKVLQKKDDKSKARLLCRSDGMGNVLLNTNIVKSFQYVPLTAENENLVKTPVIDSDGKLITYIVKFKMKADGRAFIKAISDCQKDLE